MDALTPAETAFVVRRLAAAAPHIVALAPIIDRDDLVRLCREDTGVDVRVDAGISGAAGSAWWSEPLRGSGSCGAAR